MSFFIGVDLGQVSEPTALVVVESDTLERVRTEKVYDESWISFRSVYRGRDGMETTEHPSVSYALRHLERISPGTSYPAIVERVQDVARAVPHPLLAIDITGVGAPVSDLFGKAGLGPWLVQVMAGEEVIQDGMTYRVPKKELVSTAQILLQTSRLRIARGLSLSKLLVKELLTFRMKMGLKEDDPGVWRDGVADDLVLGLSIALWMAERHGAPMGPIMVGRTVFGEGTLF